jgi:uncharacterized damage-inducible protein DinB
MLTCALASQTLANAAPKLPPESRENVQTAAASKRKLLDKKAAENLGHATLGPVAEVGRTLVLILALAGAEVVRQEIRTAKLEAGPVDPSRLKEMSFAVAERIVNDGQFWSSILGSGIVASLAKQPLQILNAIISNPTSKNALINVLHSSISSLITFGGWEASAELWEEACLLLDSESDYTRSKDFFGLLKGAKSDLEDRRILGLIVDNIGRIILADDELRTNWLYNSWRLRIATGQFATIVTTMTSAALIGTALFPGAGTLAGMMFGAIGGVAAIAIPGEVKESITDGFRGLRTAHNRLELKSNTFLIEELIRGRNPTYNAFETDIALALSSAATEADERVQFAIATIQDRTRIRENLMTILLETDYDDRAMIKRIEEELANAQQTLNSIDGLNDETSKAWLKQTIAEDEKLVASRTGNIRAIENAMNHVYAAETASLERLLKEASRPSRQARNIAAQLEQELEKVRALSLKLLKLTTQERSLDDQEVMKWVQLSRMRGFKESRL